MIRSDLKQHATLSSVGKPVVHFVLLSSVLVLAVGLLAELLFGVFMPSLLVFGLISGIGLWGMLHFYPHNVLGACNGVTLLRAAMVSILVAAIFVQVQPLLVFGFAVLAFALDGVDGWLARNAGLVSSFGARFDMEIDALLGAVLALILLSGGDVGPEILILGFSRYIFVLAGLIWPALQGNLGESLRRRVICVIQIAALITLIFPLTPAALLTPIAVGAAAALIYSFAVDARDLMRRTA